ncbi:hypothetical protein VSH64_16275 [Amycolatopsis rhabdoformis]|uniref:Uncharacterized protein n=1 Tax=Amycolatopsis rhabdoformis TaxID=1448059 RepID=A0ABZ1IHK6_9PSEU|nr:hypothetical protein [Amycolatopsis rhabdoformis]WSE33643.1 hypothetical protein VSH64_16275 [Amycolatopsis rhabdoformis]
MKSVVWWSIGALFGLALMALGLFGSGSASGTVLCGSEHMKPGDTCERTQYGLTATETYEEKLQESVADAKTFEGGGRWVTFGIGTAIAGACGWRLVVAIRRRANRGSGAGVAPVGPGEQSAFAPQGFPAGQNFQQQPGMQQGFPHQPGFQQQEFPPPQGFQQPPPPGYQQPQGPYQQ